MSNAPTPPAQHLAYLVSRYPAVSHTFIVREVRHLRAKGLDIRVASINDPDCSDADLTAEERAEASAAYYVKREGWRGVLKAHAEMLVTRPGAYLSGLRYSLRLGGSDLRKLLYALFNFIEAILIGRWMSRQGLEHLHVHFATPASTVGLIASRSFPITLSLTVHGPDEFYDALGYHLTEKIMGADFVCCIGNYARSQLMKLSPVSQWHKLEIAPSGVDPEIFAPRPFRNEPKPFEILCVGPLVPGKGQRILLAALARLDAAGREVHLRLVGDGADRGSLQEEVTARSLGSRVKLEGAVNQDRMRQLYATADVFALASFAEGIPVVLMEAMAMEIPCVATFITGIPELIRDGVDGLLVEPSDDEALADAIGRLIDDPALRQRLGRAGRRKVMAKYHLQRNTDRLATIFRRRLQGYV